MSDWFIRPTHHTKSTQMNSSPKGMPRNELDLTAGHKPAPSCCQDTFHDIHFHCLCQVKDFPERSGSSSSTCISEKASTKRHVQQDWSVNRHRKHRCWWNSLIFSVQESLWTAGVSEFVRLWDLWLVSLSLGNSRSLWRMGSLSPLRHFHYNKLIHMCGRALKANTVVEVREEKRTNTHEPSRENLLFTLMMKK